MPFGRILAALKKDISSLRVLLVSRKNFENVYIHDNIVNIIGLVHGVY